MFNIKNWFKRNKKIEEKIEEKSAFDNYGDIPFVPTTDEQWETMWSRHVQQGAPKITQRPRFSTDSKIITMDASSSIKAQFNPVGNPGVSSSLASWYSTQSFIGYQFCAILAQQWLIGKACAMPAEDAFRKGFRVTINDGTEIDPKILSVIEEYNEEYNIKYQLFQLIRMSRIFGIRIAYLRFVNPDNPEMPITDIDPDFYIKPFNIDGVLPGSYKGIVQIDPYWITPELDAAAAADPLSPYFYEPTWWVVNGKPIHRTHLIIVKTEEPPDILKPTYYYGGIPTTQKIFERVYGGERIANEAPLLALTKRTFVQKTDISKALANQAKFMQKVNWQTSMQNNYGRLILNTDDDFSQLDTALADLDAVINNQYHLVAAAADVPGTKLMGTDPRGFNATGDYQERSYHEKLESEQTKATPLAKRHIDCIIKSEIVPRFGVQPFTVKIMWPPLRSMSPKEEGEVRALNAATDKAYYEIGALGSQDVRNRIVSDSDSGYNGLELEELPEAESEEQILEQLGLTENAETPREDIF